MNRVEIIKAICWELVNYQMGIKKEPTEKIAEHILNLCVEYYGYLNHNKEIEK